jgi:acetate---CoA ligase (ADP-forming)
MDSARRHELETDDVLPDGSTIHVRPIRPDDKQRMLEMWARTSAESRRSRFHGLFNLDASNIGRFTDLDPALQLALVGTRGRGERESILGVARYERDPDAPDIAEFAALVEDAHQGRGIGTCSSATSPRPPPTMASRTSPATSSPTTPGC